MPLFDLNKIAKQVQKSAGDIAKTVSDTAGKVSEMKQEDMAKAAKKAFRENTTLKEAVVALGLLTEEEYDETVKPEKMV